jgi:hypothetical protein
MEELSEEKFGLTYIQAPRPVAVSILNIVYPLYIL